MSNQCSKPSGLLGRFVLNRMNWSHSRVTDWGLSHITVSPTDRILDVGCGGGRTIAKLAALVPQGHVTGVDHSDAAVATSRKLNAKAIAAGRVEIVPGSVSALPFPDTSFTLATAVETHFHWPNLPGDMREVFRILAPGATFCLIAEIYRGGAGLPGRVAELYAAKSGVPLLTLEEHRELLEATGYSNVQIFEQRQKGWVCATGLKL
jgi:ubiquinone/menaquinone biosynthesis C-methylase UbiE